MTKTRRATVEAVLDALKLQGCITGYTIGNRNVHPDWSDHGFDKALEEFKTNSKPFGLHKKSERAWLMILLAEKNKNAVDEWTLTAFKQTYGP